MNEFGRLVCAMMEYDGDPRRVNHFLKVYGYAKAIGEEEGLDGRTQRILETAALTHDIGIKLCLEKYNSDAGNHQQELGPSVAHKLLSGLGFESDVIERVCYLIAHHHTYSGIDGQDYQILVEADFIVNVFEHGSPKAEIESVVRKIFKTKTGVLMMRRLYGD